MCQRESGVKQIRSHKDLIVWQRAISLVELIYQETAHLPREEKFGLTSQIRRSAISVASNIAEGSARHTGRAFLQFLYIARGSLCELETQLEISRRLGYLEPSSVLETRVSEIGRILGALIKRMQAQRRPNVRGA